MKLYKYTHGDITVHTLGFMKAFILINAERISRGQDIIYEMVIKREDDNGRESFDTVEINRK